MQVDINTILEDLKSGKASRTQDSLDKLNALLEARFNAGEKDYSIAAIGRVSKAKVALVRLAFVTKRVSIFAF